MTRSIEPPWEKKHIMKHGLRSKTWKFVNVGKFGVGRPRKGRGNLCTSNKNEKEWRDVFLAYTYLAS
jgi:hypothetical protein